MLKAGAVKCKPLSGEAWPRQVKPATSSSSPQHNNDTDDYGQQIPSYKDSLSDAIQAALDSFDQTSGKHS